MQPSFTAFKEELLAIKEAGGFSNLMRGLASEAGTHKTEIAGLGVLAAPSLDEAQAHARAAVAGDYNKAGVEKRTLLPHVAKPATELAGLGMLMGPSIAHLKGYGP
jgi:hypothetical protein